MSKKKKKSEVNVAQNFTWAQARAGEQAKDRNKVYSWSQESVIGAHN